MTRAIMIACVGMMALSGCCNIAGPFETWKKPKPDLPGYTIEEQRRRARDKYALQEEDWRVGPDGYADKPSPTGR